MPPIDRAQSALSTGCFLALTAVLVLVTGYFGALQARSDRGKGVHDFQREQLLSQVYVLQVEFATGIVSLSRPCLHKAEIEPA